MRDIIIYYVYVLRFGPFTSDGCAGGARAHRPQMFLFGSWWSLFTVGHAISLLFSVLRLSRELCYYFFPFTLYIFVSVLVIETQTKVSPQ